MKLFGNTRRKKKKTAAPDKSVKHTVGRAERKLLRRIPPMEDPTQYSPEQRAEIDARIIKYQKRKTRRRIFSMAVLIALAVALFTASKLYIKPPDIRNPGNSPDNEGGGEESPLDDISATGRKSGVYTFLVVGKDDGNGNTDTIMVGMFDTENEKLNVVSIPRDTMVNVPYSNKKINAVYSLSDKDEEGLMDALEDIMGFRVDCNSVVSLSAFERLVDAIDGVDYYVPVNMNYEDPTQDLYIHISKGQHHLDGKDAVKVMRFLSDHSAALGKFHS